MEAYKRWVRRNKDYVHSLETLANGLTWILPERFSDSEIGAEAVTSILGILTTINDHIIETTPTKPVIIGQDEPSPFPYSLSITLLKDLETLVEVAAQHFLGDDKKWNFICVTEAIKSMFRLSMFRNSGYKMLLHGGETVNAEKETNASNPNPRYGTLNGYLQTPSNFEGRALSALNRFGANARTVSEPTWLSRLQHHQTHIEPPIPKMTVKEPMKLFTLLSEKGVPGGLFVIGEVMFILRPLLYVLLIKKYGVRSWLPWFTSLSVDLVGNGILAYVTMAKHRQKKGLFHQSESERNELKRRKLLWALYVMRDPFFTKYTRKKLERTQTMLEPVPIVAFFTEKLIELIIGAQTRYTYMSGS